MYTQCVIDAITTAVNGLNFLVFVSIVITSVVLALVFCPIMLRRYQRRVEALMATGLTETTDKAGEFVEASLSTASTQPPNQEELNRDALLGAAQGGLQRLYKTQFLSIALFATFTTVTITFYYMIANEEPIYSPRAWLENSIYPLVVAVGGTAPLFLMNMLNRRLKVRLCVFFGVVLILAAFYTDSLESLDVLRSLLDVEHGRI